MLFKSFPFFLFFILNPDQLVENQRVSCRKGGMKRVKKGHFWGIKGTGSGMKRGHDQGQKGTHSGLTSCCPQYLLQTLFLMKKQGFGASFSSPLPAKRGHDLGLFLKPRKSLFLPVFDKKQASRMIQFAFSTSFWKLKRGQILGHANTVF